MVIPLLTIKHQVTFWLQLIITSYILQSEWVIFIENCYIWRQTMEGAVKLAKK